MARVEHYNNLQTNIDNLYNNLQTNIDNLYNHIKQEIQGEESKNCLRNKR